jgi:ribonuclease-3
MQLLSYLNMWNNEGGNMPKLEDLEARLGLKFNNLGYLKQALTHASYANEGLGDFKSNERLEFLGDAVLELAVSEFLFHKYPQLPEGSLTKRRAAIVCETSLVEYARAINLGEFIYLGKGEELSGGRERPSLLADAFEALLGAVYLDQGFQAAKELIVQTLNSVTIWEQNLELDYKTRLQERLQSGKTEHSLHYRLISAEGPDHNKTFTVGIYVDGVFVAQGLGKSKKEAEQAAAKAVMEQMQLQ